MLASVVVVVVGGGVDVVGSVVGTVLGYKN